MRQPFVHECASIAAPYSQAGKWHTFSGSEGPSSDRHANRPACMCHTQGPYRYDCSFKRTKISFGATSSIAQRVQLQHPEGPAMFASTPD